MRKKKKSKAESQSPDLSQASLFFKDKKPRLQSTFSTADDDVAEWGLPDDQASITDKAQMDGSSSTSSASSASPATVSPDSLSQSASSSPSPTPSASASASPTSSPNPSSQPVPPFGLFNATAPNPMLLFSPQLLTQILAVLSAQNVGMVLMPMGTTADHPSVDEEEEEIKFPSFSIEEDVSIYESVETLIQTQNALGKIINSPPSDDHDWHFLFNQLLDPQNVRPYRPHDLDRSITYRFGKRVERKSNEERGKKKEGTEHIKKTATFLFPPHARTPTFPVKHPVGIIFSLSDCIIKPWHIYLFNIKSNEKPWLDPEIGPYLKSITLENLRKYNAGFAAVDEPLPQHSEILAGPTLVGTRAIFAPVDQLKARLNALTKAYLTQADLKLKKPLPIFIIHSDFGCKRYTRLQQMQDIYKILKWNIYKSMDVEYKILLEFLLANMHKCNDHDTANFFGFDLDFEDILINCYVVAGRVTAVKRLLSQGWDINISGFERITPLMYAILEANKEIIQLLLQEKNIDFLDVVDQDGRCIIDFVFSKRSEQPDLLDFFIRNSVNFGMALMSRFYYVIDAITWAVELNDFSLMVTCSEIYASLASPPVIPIESSRYLYEKAKDRPEFCDYLCKCGFFKCKEPGVDSFRSESHPDAMVQLECDETLTNETDSESGNSYRL